LIPLSIFVLNLIVQNWNLGKLILPGSDEGVYLYSAKLLDQGLIPYKDFFLSHPPFLFFIAQILLRVFNYNINIFHLVYTILVFLAIFPIYQITYKLTKDELASLLSIILFSTYPIFVNLDAHFFALRQFSITLLAFSVFFLIVKEKNKLSGFLLGLFSLSVIPNIFISLSFIFSFLLIGYLYSGQKIKESQVFIKTWALVTIIGYLLIFLIPNSINNIINYQLNRSFVTYISRIESIKSGFLPLNWPIILFGFLGSISASKKLRIFGIFNILSFLCIMSLGSSFHSHYLAILSFGLSISSGLLVFSLKRFPVFKIFVFFIILISLYITSFSYLKSKLIDETTPEFFRLSEALKDVPSPIFTYQPIYGLYNRKELTFHYHVADMRYFSVIGHNLDKETYQDIINRSNSVLLTSFDFLSLPENVFRDVNKNFKLIYNQDGNKVYIKN